MNNDAQLVQIGAAILARYKHPDDWRAQLTDGPDVHRRRIASMVLGVNELNTNRFRVETAILAARGIRTWAMSIGLLPGQLYIREPHAPQRGREHIPPVVSVAYVVWDETLRHLKRLSQ